MCGLLPSVPFPSPGDVGSFVVKLVEGLRGQMWASDWQRVSAKVDRTEGADSLRGAGQSAWWVMGSWQARLLALRTCLAPSQGEGTDARSPALNPVVPGSYGEDTLPDNLTWWLVDGRDFVWAQLPHLGEASWALVLA